MHGRPFEVALALLVAGVPFPLPPPPLFQKFFSAGSVLVVSVWHIWHIFGPGGGKPLAPLADSTRVTVELLTCCKFCGACTYRSKEEQINKHIA